MTGGIQSNVLHVSQSNTHATHARTHTRTLTCTKRPPLSVPASLQKKSKLGESRANQNQRQPMSKITHCAQAEAPEAKLCTLLFQMVEGFWFFAVILRRDEAQIQSRSDHARCGKYAAERIGTQFLRCLTGASHRFLKRAFSFVFSCSLTIS